jgi:hypothetical protein
MKKIILFIALGLALLVGGFLIAKALQDDYPVHQYNFGVKVVSIGDCSLVLSPDELKIPKGSPGTITITATGIAGFDGKIWLTAFGLPDGSWTFSVNPLPVGGSSVLTIDSSKLSTNMYYGCTLTATGNY